MKVRIVSVSHNEIEIDIGEKFKINEQRSHTIVKNITRDTKKLWNIAAIQYAYC